MLHYDHMLCLNHRYTFVHVTILLGYTVCTNEHLDTKSSAQDACLL